MSGTITPDKLGLFCDSLSLSLSFAPTVEVAADSDKSEYFGRARPVAVRSSANRQ